MPDDTPDTPLRSPSLTGQTIRFSEAVVGYDAPTPTDPRGLTCPLSDTRLQELFAEAGDFATGREAGEHISRAIVTADRARLREWFRVVYGDSSPFDRACGDVDAKAREVGNG